MPENDHEERQNLRLLPLHPEPRGEFIDNQERKKSEEQEAEGPVQWGDFKVNVIQEKY